MFHNTQDMMLRWKLEEQADLKQAIELQVRRLMNLQLLDLNHHHHSHDLVKRVQAARDEMQWCEEGSLLTCTNTLSGKCGIAIEPCYPIKTNENIPIPAPLLRLLLILLHVTVIIHIPRAVPTNVFTSTITTDLSGDVARSRAPLAALTTTAAALMTTPSATSIKTPAR